MEIPTKCVKINIFLRKERKQEGFVTVINLLIYEVLQCDSNYLANSHKIPWVKVQIIDRTKGEVKNLCRNTLTNEKKKNPKRN